MEKSLKNKMNTPLNDVDFHALDPSSLSTNNRSKNNRSKNGHLNNTQLHSTLPKNNHSINTKKTNVIYQPSQKDLPVGKKNLLPSVSVVKPIVSFPSTLSPYIQKINAYPLLSEKEEKKLAKQWIENHDYTAANQLALSYLRLVVKIAMGYRGYGLPVMDMISEGNVGLLESIKRFDLAKNVRLSTYAMWWIKAQIHEYILSMWTVVKINKNNTDKKLFFNLRKLKQSLGMDENQTQLNYKNANRLSKKLGIDSKNIASMNQMLQERSVSLNTPHTDSFTEFGDILPDTKNPSAESELTQSNEKQWRHALLEEAITTLSDREQTIFRQRLLTSSGPTLGILAKKHDISIERVRQIEKRAFQKIQVFIQKNAKERGFLM